VQILVTNGEWIPVWRN